jgi:hypothetical protein
VAQALGELARRVAENRLEGALRLEDDDLGAVGFEQFALSRGA